MRSVRENNEAEKGMFEKQQVATAHGTCDNTTGNKAIETRQELNDEDSGKPPEGSEMFLDGKAKSSLLEHERRELRLKGKPLHFY